MDSNRKHLTSFFLGGGGVEGVGEIQSGGSFINKSIYILLTVVTFPPKKLHDSGVHFVTYVKPAGVIE